VTETDAEHRAFKDALYGQFARVGGALASERRLELLDLLAQGPRHVEALAAETGVSVANVSRHLQMLKAARLVDAERDGTRVFYRLADESVARLWLALRETAESRIAEVAELARRHAVGEHAGDVISREEYEALRAADGAVLVDVRPRAEYEAGHLPEAISVPLEALAGAADALPRDRRIVAYCRGAYCLFAGEAVALLRERGFDAVRLEDGWLEWRAGAQPAAPAR